MIRHYLIQAELDAHHWTTVSGELVNLEDAKAIIHAMQTVSTYRRIDMRIVGVVVVVSPEDFKP